MTVIASVNGRSIQAAPVVEARNATVEARCFSSEASTAAEASCCDQHCWRSEVGMASATAAAVEVAVAADVAAAIAPAAKMASAEAVASRTASLVRLQLGSVGTRQEKLSSLAAGNRASSSCCCFCCPQFRMANGVEELASTQVEHAARSRLSEAPPWVEFECVHACSLEFVLEAPTEACLKQRKQLRPQTQSMAAVADSPVWAAAVVACCLIAHFVTIIIIILYY